MKVILTRFTPDPVMAVEEAASQCYQSKPSPSGKIMRACYLSGHHSVLEHVSFTWHIEGVSRALLAQLTRHRIGAAFSVKSQRYCSEDQFGYYEPYQARAESKAVTPELYNTYHKFMDTCQSTYNELVNLGMRKEDARCVLPNACYTNLQLTMNLRELAHFCNERLCMLAQAEIRELAEMMATTVNDATNSAFSFMLVPKCKIHPDFNFCPESDKRSCHFSPTIDELNQKLQSTSDHFDTAAKIVEDLKQKEADNEYQIEATKHWPKEAFGKFIYRWGGSSYFYHKGSETFKTPIFYNGIASQFSLFAAGICGVLLGHMLWSLVRPLLG